MLNQNHPDDERLSALASHDTDATADTTLTAHVSACDRCNELVSDLGVLRVALAALPDLQPSRPLRLLPPVEAEASGVDRLGGWAKRFFAPVIASGAALALVGVIGTAAPALDQIAPGGGADGGAESGAILEFAAPSAAAEEPATVTDLDADGAGGQESAASPLVAAERTSPSADEAGEPDDVDALSGDVRDEAVRGAVTSERSPWPMVLFAGVALIIAALGMRWILAPRAG